MTVVINRTITLQSDRRDARTTLLGCPANGMALVEVLVASVILGVGVSGLMFAASLSLRNQGRSEQRLAATYFAQEKLAEVETVGPRVWSLGRPTQGTESRGDTGYEWKLQIDPQSIGELFRVKVTVGWQSAGGTGSVELETLLNDYEAAVADTLGEEKREGGLEANQPRRREQ